MNSAEHLRLNTQLTRTRADVLRYAPLDPMRRQRYVDSMVQALTELSEAASELNTTLTETDFEEAVE